MKSKFLPFVLILILVGSSINFAQNGKPQYLIKTERADSVLGYITIELFAAIAPLHSAYFDSLVNIKFYDSTAIHRVVPDFVIQGGDPNSRHGPRETWGEGDSTQTNIPAEFSAVSHLRGIIGAARDEDINSANSQFYVNVVDNTGLNGLYTAYGQVVEGMDLVDFIVNVPADENDNPIEKIEMFITKLGVNEEKPAVPELIAPANGTEGAIGIQKLEWNEVPGAVLYTIQIAADESFSNIISESESGGISSNALDLELGQVKYYWRVKANNGGYESDYSEPRNFITSIEAPVQISPENNSSNISITPELQWSTVTGAAGYRLQVAKVPTFSSSQIVFDSTGIQNTAFVIPKLEGETKYYWKVQGIGNGYDGPKSIVWSFTTEPATDLTDDANGLPKKFELTQNFPNPFNPSTIIKYSIPNLTNVKIEVFTIQGSLINTLVNHEQKPGIYEINFNNTQHLASGIYFYKITTNDFIQTKKMILLK